MRHGKAHMVKLSDQWTEGDLWRLSNNSNRFKFSVANRMLNIRTVIQLTIRHCECKIENRQGRIKLTNLTWKIGKMGSIFETKLCLYMIYAKADDETKKNLKLVSKAFWQCHKVEKFENNFVGSQEPRHRQMYCYGYCPKVDEFEVRFDDMILALLWYSGMLQAANFYYWSWWNLRAGWTQNSRWLDHQFYHHQRKPIWEARTTTKGQEVVRM